MDGVKDIYRYTSEDIPDIGISINTSAKRELTGKYAKNDNANYFLDENNIIGITDSIGNKIFSFQLYVTEEQKTNNFYNVVAIKPADGTEMAPFVMEYSRNSDGSKSALAYYKLNSFLNSLEQQKSSKSSDECGEFSNSTTSTSSSSTTNSGGGGTSGSWDRESSSFSNYGSYNVTTWGASSNTTVGSKRGTVDVGYGYFMMPKDEGQREKSAKGDDSEPCPKSEWLLPVNEEDHVHLIDQANNPCVAEILTKLQQKDSQKLTVPDIGGLSGTGHLAQGILDLFDKSGDYDLTFKIEEAGTDGNGNPRNASTEKIPNKNEFIVTIDDDYARNASKLALARTIIHESLHALLGFTLKTNPRSDLSVLLNEYFIKFEDRNITEHTLMSQYVEAIGYSLSVWDNHRQPVSYYNDLAWSGGMLKTEIHDELSDSKKESIEKANYAEGSAAHKATKDSKSSKCSN